jgi:hypothetical protein
LRLKTVKEGDVDTKEIQKLSHGNLQNLKVLKIRDQQKRPRRNNVGERPAEYRPSEEGVSKKE